MPTGTHSETFIADGAVHSRNVSLTADNVNKYGDSSSPITLAAASAVSAWTKTDANTASCTLASGHGLSSGTYDVYWADGVRYGVAGTVTTNTLALDGGSGTDFPESSTANVYVAVQQQVNISIDGDLAVGVSFLADVRCHVDMQDSSSASVRAVELIADEPDSWDDEESANPYAGNPITKALVSNGTAAAGTLQVLVLQDSTP